MSELRDYVVATVRSLTNDQQTPTARRENLAFDFPMDDAAPAPTD